MPIPYLLQYDEDSANMNAITRHWTNETYPILDCELKNPSLFIKLIASGIS